MTRDARAGLTHLEEAARSDALGEVCRGSGVELMVLFGSGVAPDTDPHDLDVAVRVVEGAPFDTLGFLEQLYRLTGFEGFDVMVLNRAGPVARERAMVGGRLLYQARSGLFANTQIAAIMERMDTAEFRRVELELMGR